MSGYVGKLLIDENGPVLIGSTMYGICNSTISSTTKEVLSSANNSGNFLNNNYNTPIRGTTIHIKFVNGNSATGDNITLQLGTSNAIYYVVGKFVCSPGTIISFTLDENDHWVVNDNVTTEYVFKSEYNPTNKRVITENDLGAAAEKGVITDFTNNTTSTDLPTTAAVTAYVNLLTGGLSGLSGAMHFKGVVALLPNAHSDSTFANYDAGDVVLGPNNKEYVYNKTSLPETSEWVELGDESSYALSDQVIHKPSNLAAGDIIYYNGNTFARLPVGTAGQILQVNSDATAPLWINYSSSSLDWSDITNKPTAGTNTLGLVLTTSSISNATGYTAAPIINGVVYYKDTHYTSTDSANAFTALNLIYNDGTAHTNAVATSAAGALSLATVSSGVLYIKSIYGTTTSVSTGVSESNDV